jgi:uncharacterized protein DUF3455
LISEMNRLARARRSLVVGIAAAAAALSITQIANAASPAPTIPDAIALPAGNTVFLIGHAKGFQIYTCDGKGSWGSATPDAKLFDDNGELIAKHFAGPSWQTNDGSTFVGRVVVKDGVRASVTVDPTAIPWLLLEKVSTTPGLLGDTTYIQRVSTTGGLPPASADCTAKTAGKKAKVPYTADYYFAKSTGI